MGDKLKAIDNSLTGVNRMVEALGQDLATAYDVLEASAWELRRIINELDDRVQDDDTDAAVTIEQGFRQVRVICGVLGHDVENDMCNMPEHRLCMRCDTRLPHAPVGKGFHPWEPTTYTHNALCDWPGCFNPAAFNRWDGETDRCPEHITVDGT